MKCYYILKRIIKKSIARQRGYRMKQNLDCVMELKFSKKIKFSKLIAGVSCILLALLSSYMLYASEYKFTSDKKVLSDAITKYASQGRYKVEDAYVLETKEIDGVLIAFFKDNKNPDVYGFARLLKGINMKYRLVSANRGASAYSAVVDIYEFDTRKGKYYAVGGYNLDKNIAYYGLKLHDGVYSNSTEDILKYSIEKGCFLDIKKKSDIEKSIQELQGENRDHSLYFYHQTVLLDEEGNDITEKYRIPDGDNSWGAGTGTAELFMLYVFIAIILLLGFVLARYFWSEK